MKYFFTSILIVLAWIIGLYAIGWYALDIPGWNIIAGPSMGTSTIGPTTAVTTEVVKDFWLRILSLLKLGVSGIALIYIVLIGAYMVMGSENEETIKTQRKQLVYVFIAFLFLNIPSFVYDVFFLNTTTSIDASADFQNINGWYFWNSMWFQGVFGNLVAFLRVFIFGAAVTMFTWWFFSLIVSGGDDEKKKKAKNRIVYGTIAVIFVGFVGVWSKLIAVANFQSIVPDVGRTIFNLAMYFVAPMAIFMLMYGAYYVITSAGDEERMKKWKSIVINTGIAIIILITALSFMTDLSRFQL